MVFGGWNGTTSVDDTWEFGVTGWAPRASTVRPPARTSHAMAYMASSGHVVLFGGLTTTHDSDMWTWDGSVWRQVPRTSPWPQGRLGHSLTCDTERDRLILFGGSNGVTYLGDTWEWDGGSWALVASQGPAARARSVVVYDAARRRTTLYGGYSLIGSILNDTWEWNGATWAVRLPPSAPPARGGSSVTYDSGRRTVVLFGGWTGSTDVAETWEYATTFAAQFSRVGLGCGNQPVPSLGNAGGSLPWIGDSLAIEMDNIGTNPLINVPWLLIGASDTSWGGIALPRDLTQSGMAGCVLHTSVDVSIPLPNAGGRASVSLAVPNSAGMLGARLFFQGGCTSPGINVLGILLTNSATGTVGAR